LAQVKLILGLLATMTTLRARLKQSFLTSLKHMTNELQNTLLLEAAYQMARAEKEIVWSHGDL
jgi:hypothetical protein